MIETAETQHGWTVLAHLLRPQGRHGELLADLHTDFPELLPGRAGTQLRSPKEELRPVTVESHWLPTGRNAGRVVLKLAGVDSINAAEALAGYDLVVPTSERVPLEEGAVYIDDLTGCQLVEGDRVVGTIEDVHFPADSKGQRLDDAVPLLVVRSPGGDELLIPFAKAWILSLDIPGKRLEMRLPHGLLEING
ncbi:MAG TPA: ribosome maturation factor RimM [Granulicella sp.]